MGCLSADEKIHIKAGLSADSRRLFRQQALSTGSTCYIDMQAHSHSFYVRDGIPKGSLTSDATIDQCIGTRKP